MEKKPIYILGLNAYHGDSSACLIKDGKLVAALEEERIRRTKHWAGLPSEATKFCLDFEGITLDQIDYIAVSRDPKAHFFKKILFVLKTRPSFKSVFSRVLNIKKVGGIKEELAKALEVEVDKIKAQIVNVEHHHAHLASAFFVSPFKKAVVLSVDGMGDFSSTMWGVGEDNKIKVTNIVSYPHSIGFLYTAITQYLGFWKYGDEYKIMGLSAFGEPIYVDKLKKMILMKEDGTFKLNLDYFVHGKKGIEMTWQGGDPVIGQLFSEKVIDLLGPSREKEAPLEKRHQDIAASLQKLYEELFLKLLNSIYNQTKIENLCYAGGVAQNSLANGMILKNTPFKEIYIPPDGYDAGTAVGAGYYLYNQILGNQRNFVMESPFWGAGYEDKDYKEALDSAGLKYERLEMDNLIEKTAKLIADGNIVGWFQGRTEWGPRALGNRSILANPTRPDMKEILNSKIKKRESFRPFAPSIIEEAVGDYFEDTYPVPFMEKVYVIRKEMREKLPAVTHADGTGRLQSVSVKINPLYHKLIKKVGEFTGVPMVLNTSFNENEPIVNKPEEAINCYLRTKMDVIVLGNYLVQREK